MKSLYPNVSKTIRIAALLLLVVGLAHTDGLAQVTTWQNGPTVDWNDAGNWSNGVPDATKEAWVNVCGTCPVISTAGNQARAVFLFDGSSLTIETLADLTVDRPTGDAADAVQVKNGSKLTVESSATLTVNQLAANSAIANLTGGTIENKGTTNISGGSTGLFSLGTVTNYGRMFVSGTTGIGVDNNSGADFTNRGLLDIQNAGGDGLNNSSATFDNYETINIDNISGSNGITGFGSTTFTNHQYCGHITTSQIVFTFGTFINHGVIVEKASGNSQNVTMNSATGIIQNLNGGTFTIATNNGVLTTNPAANTVICDRSKDYFSTAGNQFASGTSLKKQHVYETPDAAASITLFEDFLPSSSNLDAVDVTLGGTYFSVDSTRFVTHTGGGISLKEDKIYLLMLDGTIVEAAGTAPLDIDSLDALDRTETGYVFSTDSNEFGYGMTLRHENAYRYLSGPDDVEIAFDGKAWGLKTLDCVDIYPGYPRRVAFSVSQNQGLSTDFGYYSLKHYNLYELNMETGEVTMVIGGLQNLDACTAGEGMEFPN